jgi:hypothetical protein
MILPRHHCILVGCVVQLGTSSQCILARAGECESFRLSGMNRCCFLFTAAPVRTLPAPVLLTVKLFLLTRPPPRVPLFSHWDTRRRVAGKGHQSTAMGLMAAQGASPSQSFVSPGTAWRTIVAKQYDANSAHCTSY